MVFIGTNQTKATFALGHVAQFDVALGTATTFRPGVSGSVWRTMVDVVANEAQRYTPVAVAAEAFAVADEGRMILMGLNVPAQFNVAASLAGGATPVNDGSISGALELAVAATLDRIVALTSAAGSGPGVFRCAFDGWNGVCGGVNS